MHVRRWLGVLVVIGVLLCNAPVGTGGTATALTVLTHSRFTAGL